MRVTNPGPETLDVLPFGAYAPQALWLDGAAPATESLKAEAARLGTGVVHWPHTGQPHLAVPATSHAHGQLTAAGWLFAEHAYARVLNLPGDLGRDNRLMG